MKKSVVIIIALIYVASIALVSFFGLQFKVFNEVIPVERVEITNKTTDADKLQTVPSLGDCIVIYPNEKGELRYQINYRVHPDDATNAEVTFALDGYNASIDQNGVVVFTDNGYAKIRVIAADGTNAEDTITIIARKK